MESTTAQKKTLLTRLSNCWARIRKSNRAIVSGEYRVEAAKSETGLKEELSKARSEAAEYKELAAKIERDVVTELRSEVASLSQQLVDLQATQTKSEQRTNAKVDTTAVDKLKKEVELLQSKNAELREQKYASVEAVAQLEKTVSHMQTSSAAPKEKQGGSQAADVTKLQHDVNHYKSALQTLSSTLTALESEATAEIAKWQNRCSELERLGSLRDTVETTVVLKEIETVRDESANQQYAEVREQLTLLQSKLKDDQAELDTSREQLRILTDTLETERSTGRDLSQQAVKLRGMLKVGQEALKHEQHTVTTLREQLRLLQA